MTSPMISWFNAPISKFLSEDLEATTANVTSGEILLLLLQSTGVHVLVHRNPSLSLCFENLEHLKIVCKKLEIECVFCTAHVLKSRTKNKLNDDFASFLISFSEYLRRFDASMAVLDFDVKITPVPFEEIMDEVMDGLVDLLECSRQLRRMSSSTLLDDLSVFSVRSCRKGIPDQVRKNCKGSLKTQTIVYELLNTEYDFVNDLSLILDYILPKLKMQYPDSKIFSLNFKEVRDDHILILELIQKAIEKNGIVEKFDFFAHLVPLLESHVNYTKIYTQQVSSLMKKSKYCDFSNSLITDETARNLSLDSHLMIPIQRVTKYPLLVSKLLEIDSNFLLVQAQKELLKLMEKIDLAGSEINIPRIESMVDMSNVSRMEESRYLFDDRVMYKNQKHHLILFTDVLIVAKSQSFKRKMSPIHVIPSWKLLFLIDEDLEIIIYGQKSMVFQSKDAKVWAKFVNQIPSLIEPQKEADLPFVCYLDDLKEDCEVLVKSTQDSIPQVHNELGFKKNVYLRVVNQSRQDYYRVTMGSKTGLVRVDYVEKVENQKILLELKKPRFENWVYKFEYFGPSTPRQKKIDGRFY